jgi:hypothetical protein
MSCAIDPKLMAHQWRNWFAPLLKVALREKANGFGCAISFFPIAQHWRNSAPEQCPLAATGPPAEGFQCPRRNSRVSPV